MQTKAKKIGTDGVSLRSNFTMPLLIVGIALIIILGVRFLVTSHKGMHDLVGELESQTFGNKWVAAYELSKFVSAKKLDEKEVEWLVSRLIPLHQNTKDEKIRTFIVVTLSNLGNDERVIPFLFETAYTDDLKSQFYAVVALGNMGPGQNLNDLVYDKNWAKLMNALKKSEDTGLIQAGIYALANQRVPAGEEFILNYLQNFTGKKKIISYVAAISLIKYRSNKISGHIAELLTLTNSASIGIEDAELKKLKLGLLNIMKSEKWPRDLGVLEKIKEISELPNGDLELKVRAKEVSNLLKI